MLTDYGKIMLLEVVAQRELMPDLFVQLLDADYNEIVGTGYSQEAVDSWSSALIDVDDSVVMTATQVKFTASATWPAFTYVALIDEDGSMVAVKAVTPTTLQALDSYATTPSVRVR